MTQRVLANKKDNLLAFDFEGLFDKIGDLIDKICVKRTHILLLAPIDANIIIDLDKNKYKRITHISDRHYFYQIKGYVFHRNLDPLLSKTLSQM